MNEETRHTIGRIMDCVPTMFAYWGADGRCRYASRAYEAWFDRPPGSLVGSHYRDLLGHERLALYEPHLVEVMAGRRQTVERYVVDGAGVSRSAIVEMVPDLEHGEVVGFVIQVNETTSLKAMEAALRREQALRSDIEGHARRLDALLAERDEMLQVLAHEVRQPLNNAQAALQNATLAIAARPADATASASSASAMAAAGVAPLTRASAVLAQVVASVDNTLAVASLLARAEPIERQDVDLDVLVAVVISDMPLAERHRVRFERLTSCRSAAMDPGLMRLALRNVLANALRHGRPGSPVTLRLSESEEPLALMFDIVDDGDGFGPDVRQRLFQRGARGQSHGAGRHGIGLYLARRVMEMHGGSAQLISDAPGEVTLRLTLNPVESD